MQQEISPFDHSQHTRDFLSGKIKQLEEMRQMIAHNLRGPAANIKMLSEILGDKDISEKLPDPGEDIFPAQEVIYYINQSSISLLRTLDTLMDLMNSKPDETKKYGSCDIVAIVGNVTDQLNGFIRDKNAIITLDLAVTHIDYPIAYMESILYNFLSNSIKYSRPGVQTNIVISTYRQHEKVLLSVRDNGIGINLTFYGQKIFNLYEIFHSGYESKGIGLYIIRQQVESLGGTVSVKSRVNEGTEFIVTF